MLQALSPSLRMKVAGVQYTAVVAQRNGHLFGGCNPQFLQLLMACLPEAASLSCECARKPPTLGTPRVPQVKLREVYLMPSEEIAQQRDSSRELFFVAHGALELLKDGALVRTVRAESEAPSVVGDVAFFVGVAQPHTVACAPKGAATCLVLTKGDYEELLKAYPDQNEVRGADASGSAVRSADPVPCPGSLARCTRSAALHHLWRRWC